MRINIPENDLARLGEFEKILRYSFRDISLLYQALMHKSYLNEMPELDMQDNERYEFLGDAVLEFIVTEYLFGKYPNDNEGDLTERRSCTVDRSNCARMAKIYRLEEFVFLGRGERTEGKAIKRSILANALEAVVAAIYLDGGLEECRKFVTGFVEKYRPTVGEGVCRNFKAELQKYVQKIYQTIPIYRDISAIGPDHEKTFEVSVWMNDKLYGKGKGPNKKTAQQHAARSALKKIMEEENNAGNFIEGDIQ
jgi:ribonuclease III